MNLNLAPARPIKQVLPSRPPIPAAAQLFTEASEHLGSRIAVDRLGAGIERLEAGTDIVRLAVGSDAPDYLLLKDAISGARTLHDALDAHPRTNLDAARTWLTDWADTIVSADRHATQIYIND